MFSNFLNRIYVNHATHKERRLEHHRVNYGFNDVAQLKESELV